MDTAAAALSVRQEAPCPPSAQNSPNEDHTPHSMATTAPELKTNQLNAVNCAGSTDTRRKENPFHRTSARMRNTPTTEMQKRLLFVFSDY